MPTPPYDIKDSVKLTEEQMRVLCKCEDELYVVALKLNQYRYLYETTALGVTMNETAASFFSLVQRSFANDMLQSLARLFDPPQSVGKENCSLKWLQKNFPVLPTSTVRDEINKKLVATEDKQKEIGNWRNKIGSHNSKDHVLKIEKVPPILISTIVELISEIGELLNYVRRQASPHAGFHRFNYEPDVDKGAMELISYLKDGITYRRQQQRNKV